MHSNFNVKYTIFFDGDLSGEIKWIDKSNPDQEHTIPEDVVKLIKQSCCSNFINILHDRLTDIMWEEM